MSKELPPSVPHTPIETRPEEQVTQEDGKEVTPEQFPQPEDKGRMNNEEAQQEANMLRAELKVSPETGEIPGGGNEFDKDRGRSFEIDQKPTAEDYDNALTAIEELKKLVAEEPSAERVINKLKDLPLKAAAGIELAFRALGIGIETFTVAGVLDPDNREGEGIGRMMKRRWERDKSTHENEDLGLFQDAENNLTALKKRADSLGKQESASNAEQEQ